MLKYEEDYLNALQHILDNGHNKYNERTGKVCRTVLSLDLEYDAAKDVPLLTSKQCYAVSAAAEIIGYYRRYTNAQQFADIGSPTWFGNSNDNADWLANPHRKGENDLGPIYGAGVPEQELRDIYENLCNGVDNRRLIYDMWRPELFDKIALPPCAYLHHWHLIDEELSLTVHQRSADFPLGVPFNSFSFVFLLKLMAKITGNKVGKVYHKMADCHIYEDQIPKVGEQLRNPTTDLDLSLEIADWVTDLDDVVNSDRHARDYFILKGYPKDLPKVRFPFSA